MGYIVPHYIAGKACTETNSKGHDIYNPAFGEMIGRVNFADIETCNKAIAIAKEAWPSWSQTPPIKRASILFKFRELLEKYQLDLARLVTQEHGKTLDDAKGSVARGIELVEFHCGLMYQLQGTFSANLANRIDCNTIPPTIGI